MAGVKASCGIAAGYFRVMGMGAPGSSKTRRWTGVGWGPGRCEARAVDGGGLGEFGDVLAAEGDGLPVECGQVAEQVAVLADGEPGFAALGGVFGFGPG